MRHEHVVRSGDTDEVFGVRFQRSKRVSPQGGINSLVCHLERDTNKRSFTEMNE